MGLNYIVNVDVGKLKKKKGLEPGGRVEQVMAHEVIRLSEPYIPLDTGALIQSGHVEHGNEAVWNVPYAHYMWGGIVYEDPVLHAAGFQLPGGEWVSRKGVNKVPTNRELHYSGEPRRGARWVPRMLQDGGMDLIEDAIRREIAK